MMTAGLEPGVVTRMRVLGSLRRTAPFGHIQRGQISNGILLCELPRLPRYLPLRYHLLWLAFWLAISGPGDPHSRLPSSPRGARRGLTSTRADRARHCFNFHSLFFLSACQTPGPPVATSAPMAIIKPHGPSSVQHRYLFIRLRLALTRSQFRASAWPPSPALCARQTLQQGRAVAGTEQLVQGPRYLLTSR